MQPLLTLEDIGTDDWEWRRMAVRECIAYGEHGDSVEYVDGHRSCFNCRGRV